MKKSILFSALLILLLPTLESCGNDSDNRDSHSEHRNSRKGGRCRISTSSEEWRNFVDKVKNLEFEEFSSWNSCTEYHHYVKTQNCDMKGIFYICDGTFYNKPDGTNSCSSGDKHEKDLIALVTPRPKNFEAEICGDKMVGAQIAVSGKGKQHDLYRFDFEQPVHYNPVWKQVWRDGDRRYRTTIRQ